MGRAITEAGPRENGSSGHLSAFVRGLRSILGAKLHGECFARHVAAEAADTFERWKVRLPPK